MNTKTSSFDFLQARISISVLVEEREGFFSGVTISEASSDVGDEERRPEARNEGIVDSSGELFRLVGGSKRERDHRVRRVGLEYSLTGDFRGDGSQNGGGSSSGAANKINQPAIAITFAQTYDRAPLRACLTSIVGSEPVRRGLGRLNASPSRVSRRPMS